LRPEFNGQFRGGRNIEDAVNQGLSVFSY